MIMRMDEGTKGGKYKSESAFTISLECTRTE